MKTMITKYIHGWLPKGTQRKLIHNGEDSCPQWECQETNEHIIICRNPKTRYKSYGNQAVSNGKCYPENKNTHKSDTSMVRLNQTFDVPEWKAFHSPLCTSYFGKKIIYQSLKHQGALGKELTLRGYLVKRWNKAAKNSDIDDNMAPGKLHESWVPSAITNLWMVAHRSWIDRKEILHSTIWSRSANYTILPA